MRLSSRSAPAAVGGFVLLGLLASACTVPGFGPKPDDTVERLAASLSQGSVKGVHFVDGDTAAAKEYAEVTDGVGEAEAKVAEVATDGSTASGVLEWRRKVGSKTWSYKTGVQLLQDPDSEDWLVEWRRDIVEPSLKSDEVLATSSVKAPRGDILGAKDKALVTSRPVLRVGLDKTGLAASDVRPSALALARLVGVAAKPVVERATAAGPRAFVEVIVYRRSETPEKVLSGISAIEGARGIADRRPLAPSKDFAAALLGTVGPATAELVKDGGGRIRPGDDVGLSGLQKRYDEQLAGKPGVKVLAVDAEGGRRELFATDPEPGEPLRTTLDLKLQQLAQDALADIGPASALVAIRPSTGDLLAAASGPGSKGYNTATFGRYPPGSTFKVVSALALLRSGLKPTSEVDCPPTTVVDGKQFKNYSDYPASGLGRISLEDALANSCNTAFIGQRDRIRGEALTQAAAALGLGVDHDLGFPAYFGQVTPGDDVPLTETQRAAALIGQGAVLASPMVMATVVASVMDGTTVVPRLLPEQGEEKGSAEADPAKPLTRAEAKSLRAMMRAVVERGSGTSLQGLPGGQVIAKTGTAEFGRTAPLPTHAWMVAGHDDLAVAVFVERGESGSGTAGPVLKRFLEGARVQ